MAVDLGKIGMTPKGNYDIFHGPYEKLDVVTYEGSSYVSLIDDNDIPIGAVGAWQLIASKGDSGNTPDIQVGPTETLAPGEPASVEISGTVEEPILTFKIPKGEKGDTGEGFVPSYNDDFNI